MLRICLPMSQAKAAPCTDSGRTVHAFHLTLLTGELSQLYGTFSTACSSGTIAPLTQKHHRIATKLEGLRICN